MTPAVFLDRDNTLIQNDGDLGDPAQVRLLQGAASAIASLRGLGYRVIVVTNQGGVARGKYGEADVEAVHQRVNELIHGTSGASVDRFYYCPYHPEGTIEKYRREHPWRKPQPGMLLQAAKDLSIDLGQSWLVGDQTRDVDAGLAAGVRTILLDGSAEELSPLQLERIAAAQAQLAGEGKSATGPHFTARNLVEAVRIIAQQRTPQSPEEMRQREKAGKRWDAEAVRAARSGDATAAAPPNAGSAAATPITSAKLASAPVQVPQTATRPSPSNAITPTRPGVSAVASSSPAVAPIAAAPASLAPTVTPVAKPQANPAQSANLEANESEKPIALSDPPRLANTGDPAAMLGQILQELRSQRGRSDDFAATKVFAIVLQSLAVVCLLGGLWLGHNDGGTFMRWVGVSLIVQLATIAALLFAR